MLQDIFTLCFDFFMWYFLVPASIWNLVDSQMAQWAWCREVAYKNDMLHAYLFMLVWTILSAAVSLPFSIYATFVIEEKWGYNKTTANTFVMDLLKSFFVSAVLLAVFMPLILWII